MMRLVPKMVNLFSGLSLQCFSAQVVLPEAGRPIIISTSHSDAVAGPWGNIQWLMHTYAQNKDWWSKIWGVSKHLSFSLPLPLSLPPSLSLSLSPPPPPSHLCCSDFVFFWCLLQWYEILHSLHLTPGRRGKIEAHSYILCRDMREQSLVFALILLESEGCFKTLTVLGEEEGTRCALQILRW